MNIFILLALFSLSVTHAYTQNTIPPDSTHTLTQPLDTNKIAPPAASNAINEMDTAGLSAAAFVDTSPLSMGYYTGDTSTQQWLFKSYFHIPTLRDVKALRNDLVRIHRDSLTYINSVGRLYKISLTDIEKYKPISLFKYSSMSWAEYMTIVGAAVSIQGLLQSTQTASYLLNAGVLFASVIVGVIIPAYTKAIIIKTDKEEFIIFSGRQTKNILNFLKHKLKPEALVQ